MLNGFFFLILHLNRGLFWDVSRETQVLGNWLKFRCKLKSSDKTHGLQLYSYFWSASRMSRFYAVIPGVFLAQWRKMLLNNLTPILIPSQSCDFPQYVYTGRPPSKRVWKSLMVRQRKIVSFNTIKRIVLKVRSYSGCSVCRYISV